MTSQASTGGRPLDAVLPEVRALVDRYRAPLHPFDLATNKVLALAGQLEPRDWVDVILSGERLQPLGYLAWAACGKDPGFNPAAILEHAARASRYLPTNCRRTSSACPRAASIPTSR